MGLATFHAPHLVILDEPTNHLDIDSRAALIEAINEYRGAVILVSHDRYLIDACADRLWVVADGGVRAAEAAIDPERLRRAHDDYAAERDAALPSTHTGPRPHGGVGGTRTGVKCLHAHYAHYLAGGDDPVGAWVAARLANEEDAP